MCKLLKQCFYLSFILFCQYGYAMHNPTSAVTEVIPIREIPQFKNYSPSVKELINNAKALTEKNLTYLYGSSNPDNKGLDCSGTIYYLLKHTGISDVPRQANEMYVWAEHSGNLHKVSNQDPSSRQYNDLKPGDLLFWEGTYKVKRIPPITHVMIYLGKNSQGEPIMFGASDGRTYHHKRMWGVSVFDFRTTNGRGANFVGYSCIPNLTCS